MASLSTLISQYPILDTLCRSLRVADFTALSQASSEHRLMLKGLQRPDLLGCSTTFRPVTRSCTCQEDHDACCPRHGTTILRNLLQKTNRACEDARHRTHYSILGRNVPNIWVSTICDALGGISNTNYCSDCRINVCWLCWLDPAQTSSRGSLAHYACGECWETSFETLRQLWPSRLGNARFEHISWKTAQQQGAFCQCITSILCSTCIDRRSLRPAPTPAEMVVDMRRKLALTRDSYSSICTEDIGSPQYECAGCTIFVSRSDRSPPNLFCPDCNLPVQIRNHDHPIHRQSQFHGSYYDDVNYDTGRVGPEYGSIKEFWACELARVAEEDDDNDHDNNHGWKTLPPKSWEPVEFAWEQFNKASLIPAEKKSTVTRSSYFQPIKKPSWGFEEALFVPPPYITTFNNWQNIVRGVRLLLYSEELMTFEQYMKWYGYTDKSLEKRRRELAMRKPCFYPTVRNFLLRAEYFNPIQHPVWDFEHAIFQSIAQKSLFSLGK